jgi:hypothetical protein
MAPGWHFPQSCTGAQQTTTSLTQHSFLLHLGAIEAVTWYRWLQGVCVCVTLNDQLHQEPCLRSSDDTQGTRALADRESRQGVHQQPRHRPKYRLLVQQPSLGTWHTSAACLALLLAPLLH